MKTSVFVLLCILPFFADAGITFKDCGSKTGTIKDVNIVGCTQAPCPLKRGTNATFSVDFSTKAAVTTATSVVYGVVEGVKVKFSIPNPDACKDSGLACPLKSGSSFSYHTYIPVESYYPTYTIPVEWELKDENGDDVFCMIVVVKIV